MMVGRLKDWRRIAMRNDRCAPVFFAATTLAGIVTSWIGQRVQRLGGSGKCKRVKAVG